MLAVWLNAPPRNDQGGCFFAALDSSGGRCSDAPPARFAPHCASSSTVSQCVPSLLLQCSDPTQPCAAHDDTVPRPTGPQPLSKHTHGEAWPSLPLLWGKSLCFVPVESAARDGVQGTALGLCPRVALALRCSSTVMGLPPARVELKRAYAASVGHYGWHLGLRLLAVAHYCLESGSPPHCCSMGIGKRKYIKPHSHTPPFVKCSESCGMALVRDLVPSTPIIAHHRNMTLSCCRSFGHAQFPYSLARFKALATGHMWAAPKVPEIWHYIGHPLHAAFRSCPSSQLLIAQQFLWISHFCSACGCAE